MRVLEKRLTALERRNGAREAHYYFLPFDLSEAEQAEWHETHTSPAARAAAGIPPNAQIIVVTWYGSMADTPSARHAPGGAITNG